MRPEHYLLTGQHRVVVQGVALRFFLLTGKPFAADSQWEEVTDAEFHQRFEESLFDPAALRRNVLCPNTRRVELDASDGWFWSDGMETAGLCTFDDKEPAECARMARMVAGKQS